MLGRGLLLVYLGILVVDNLTDAITALIYLSQGLYVAGSATILLLLLPGLVVFLLETKEAVRGRSNICRGLLYLVVCPFYSWFLVLYSLYHEDWREKSMFVVVLEGFLTSSPQLILQLSLWFKGSLTGPALNLLDDYPSLLHNSLQNSTLNSTSFKFLGREYEEDRSWIFGVVQILSIVVSFISVLAAGLYFNEIETSLTSPKSNCRKCLSLPFFASTTLYRAVSLAIVICFLNWWSSPIIFIFFFTTVLVSVCAGDGFFRGCLYGLWSLLLPVGFSRNPLESLGYKVYHQYTIADSSQPCSAAFLKQRAKYFLNIHLFTSAALLLPSVIITTVLVNQADASADWLVISTDFVLKLTWFNLVIVPGIGLLLAASILFGRFYQSSVYTHCKAITIDANAF